MRPILNLFAIMCLAALLAVAVGCSSDDASTNPTIVGDTTDAQFQAISGFFEDMDLEDSYEVSTFISLDLIESTFPNFAPQGFNREGASRFASGDSSVVIINSYVLTNGWHVFTFSATTIQIINQVTDTVVTFSGTDSVRVLADGVVMDVPDSTANALNIRAHFTLSSVIQSFSYTADHSLDIVFDTTAVVPGMFLDATISQNITATVSDSSFADTCNLTMNVTQVITDFAFPFDVNGDPQDCPEAGTASTTVTITFTCGTGSSLDSLSINGTWNVTAVVVASDNIKVTYTDGTTTWSTTEVCTPDSNQPASGPLVIIGRD